MPETKEQIIDGNRPYLFNNKIESNTTKTVLSDIAESMTAEFSEMRRETPRCVQD